MLREGKLTKQQRHDTGAGGAGRARERRPERIRKTNNPQMMYAI